MKDGVNYEIGMALAGASSMLDERNGPAGVGDNRLVSIWTFTQEEMEAVADVVRGAVEDNPASKTSSRLLPLWSQMRECVEQHPSKEG